MNNQERILRHFLENWEKPLATGYEKDKDHDDAVADMDNSHETIPGDTLFPTYSQLISRRNAMTDYNRRFTQTYSEFSHHPGGEK